MRFRFHADLQFQNQAIDAAVRLFEGAPVQRPEGRAWQETGFAFVCLDTALDDSQKVNLAMGCLLKVI